MARTANVFARVEPELKEQAESVLDQLGIPMSNAVGMFLRQIVLQKGIPFEMKLPRTAPLTYGSLTKEQFDKEIEKGMSDVKAGRVYSADAIEAEMKRDFVRLVVDYFYDRMGKTKNLQYGDRTQNHGQYKNPYTKI